MKLYSYNISHASDSELSEWFDAMSSERKEAVIRLKVAQKQKLKIAADHICRKAISEFCGIDPKKIEFFLSEHGKPFAKGLDVNFSISHSGDYVVCAVSKKEIGVDVEKIRKISPDISKRFACKNELEYIKAHENGFFEIWTLKEAYFKCTGTGLGADIKDVCFEITRNGVSCSENNFDCSFYEIDKEYICAVCKRFDYTP
ncbi:MAG: 4'-phosphopantetheinyl transferase superfamily protein [Clostridia bacterium]|nr:4'-phosphopantetheinyl transferase superfamily protein [Clostridia bacterium]